MGESRKKKTADRKVGVYLVLIGSILCGLIYLGIRLGSHVVALDTAQLDSDILTSPTPQSVPSTSISPTISPAQQEQIGKCDMTYYVPEVSPMWVTTTQEKCAYAQQYAVNLWNSQHQQSRQIPPPPMPQYQTSQPVQYPVPNQSFTMPQFNYSEPPAIGAPPAIQEPQVQAPASLPNVPQPQTPCYSYSVGAGAVTIPCQ